jgi:hypothetical protein
MLDVGQFRLRLRDGKCFARPPIATTHVTGHRVAVMG